MTPDIVYRNIKNEFAYLLIQKKRHEYSYNLHEACNESSKLLVESGGSLRGEDILMILLSDNMNPLEIGLADYSADDADKVMEDFLKGRKVWFQIRKLQIHH